MSALVTNEQEVNPFTMSIDQLNEMKTNLEVEIQDLQKQLESLHNAKARFNNARSSIEDIENSKAGDSLLVPLTSSLYAAGKIINPKKVKQNIMIILEII